MAKQIKTRLLLKYDTYQNWTNEEVVDKGANLVLLKGEIGLCAIETGVTTAPTVLFKVGDGVSTFKELKWASALAADVYAWAKQAELPVERADAEGVDAGNVISSIRFEDGKIKYTTTTVASSASVEDLTQRVEVIEDAKFGDAIADINAALELKANANDVYTKTEVDTKVQEAIDAIPDVDLTPYAKTADVNAALDLRADKSVVDAMYTNTQIDGFIAEAKKYADDNDANDNTEYHVEYDSENKKIKLVAGADANKMEIDATAFIKDGMISNVTIGDDNDLVITFNTDAGREDIVLPLDQLVDIYTGVEGAKVAISVSADKKISADIVAGSIAKTDLATDVQTSLGLADTALQEHQDISHLATKDEVVAVLADAQAYADEALNDYAKTADVNNAISTAINGEIARADGAYAPKEATATGITEAKNAANAAQTTADAALPKATAEADYLKKTAAASTYRAKADKITSDDLSDEVFIFNCGGATIDTD